MSLAIALFLVALMFRAARVSLEAGVNIEEGRVHPQKVGEVRTIKIALAALSAVCGAAAVTAMA